MSVTAAYMAVTSAGLDQMIFLLQAGRTTHDQVLRSIELIGKHVIPRFESKTAFAAQ